MIRLHPSSIGKIMPSAKSIDPALLVGDLLALSKKKVKTDEDNAILQPLLDQTLSVGAKTYLKSIAKQLMYDYEQELDVKYVRKGIACEDQSIALLNTVLFQNYTKNEQRITTALMSGECDILHATHIRDIKTSWSLDTFPCVQEDAYDSDYEFQLRAYMHLYDRPMAHLDFCMVTTPEEMRAYENPAIHEVDHIDPRMRVTTVSYARDLEIEARMLVKCRAAQKYVEEIKLRILSEREI